MRIALVHYWLVGMRGGERVLEALCRMFPDADIYTHVVDREHISNVILAHTIHTTFIARLPGARRFYARYLPLMPLALESLDLTAYDLVISSEAGPAKGVITRPDATHLTYCHSPMRYIWDQYHTYRAGAGRLTRLLMPFFAHYLRTWDSVSAMRTDLFVANSAFIARRIQSFYRRESEVVYPPIAVNDFLPVPPSERGDFYLWCGELAAYKRPEVAVQAFNSNGRSLVMIGDGDQRKRLERMAGDNISFVGNVPYESLRAHFARCRALIHPGEEDFGITPVEVQAAGRPVIALGRGGALETVIDGETGILYPISSTDALLDAICRFEDSGLEHHCERLCRENAGRFTEKAFRQGMWKALRRAGVSDVDAASSTERGTAACH